MASLTTDTMEAWLISRKIKLDYKTALTSLGVEEPEDFMDLEDEDIEEFATSNDLNKIQKRRLNKAYREIKYGEELNSSKSRSSSLQPTPASTTEVVGETKDSNNDGSFVVNQYRIFTDKNLSANLEGHCKVLLGETTDRARTLVVAKISTGTTSAKTLKQEYQLLEHIHQSIFPLYGYFYVVYKLT